MLDALAFLPEADVQTGMENIRQSVPCGQHSEKLLELVSYFDAIRQRRGATRPAACRQRSACVFATFGAAVSTGDVNGSERTNNLCQSWNRGLSALVRHCHPAFYLFSRSTAAGFCCSDDCRPSAVNAEMAASPSATRCVPWHTPCVCVVRCVCDSVTDHACDRTNHCHATANFFPVYLLT